MSEIKKDIRLPQAKKLAEAIVSNKTDLDLTGIYIDYNNIMAMFVRETVMYTVELVGFPPLPPIAFMYNDVKNLAEDEYICETITLFPILNNTFNTYMYWRSNNTKLAHDPDVRGIDEFEKLISMKAYEGLKFYKMFSENVNKCYFIPIFSRFPNINKADKAGISVYDLEDGYLLIEMNIFKKKINKQINMFYRTVNLNGRA